MIGTVLEVACLVVLAAATALALFRVERGPSMLDRAIGIDVITAALIGFTAVFSAMQDRTDLLHLMAALALVGFLSTVTIARFVAAESDEEGRILTAAELAAQLEVEALRAAEDAPPVHDVDRAPVQSITARSGGLPAPDAEQADMVAGSEEERP